MQVIVVEDSGLLRAAIVEALTSRGVEVLADVASPAALEAILLRAEPDVVLLDVRMPPTFTDEGLGAAVLVRSVQPACGVVLLSSYAETIYAERLLELGDTGLGYLVKDRVADPDHLVDALQRVAAGELVVDQQVVASMLRRPRTGDPLGGLSEREREVLDLMAQGRSNASLAQTMHLSPKTVETHVAALFTKLGLAPSADHNRRVLAVLAWLEAAERPTDRLRRPGSPGVRPGGRART